MNKELHTIKDEVMKRIESGAAKMRPRWQFVLQSILIAVGTILATVALLFFISLVLFSLRQSCAFCLPAFGVPGIRLFFATIPWALVFFSFLFLLILELFVKRYPIAYKKPIVYSVLAVAFFGAVGGYAVAKTGIHPMFYRATFERGIPGKNPISGTLYRYYGAPNLKHVFPGTIIEGEAGVFSIETLEGNTFTVSISPETKLPLGSEVRAGDRVLVIGEKSSGTIQAMGIRPLPDEGMFVPAMVRRVRSVPSSTSTDPIEIRYFKLRH